MAKKRILIIAYVFPPIAYAGTYRTLRLCRYLEKLNYEITVLTIKEQPDLYNDLTLLRGLNDQVSIVRTPTYDVWRFYHLKIKNVVLSLPFGKYLHKILSSFVLLFSLPDHMIGWVPFAYFYALKIQKKEKFPIIYTSSPPHSQQLIGWLLKKKFGVKWVADLRDPVVDNLGISTARNIERFALQWLEKKIFNHADVIVCNTQTAHNVVTKKYPFSRVEVVYNSFDEDEFKNIFNGKYERFTVSHIGSIYNFRKVDHILRAVQSLSQKKRVHPDRFRVIFIGLNEPSLFQEIKKYGLENLIEIQDMIPHRAALQAMVRSHMLLLIKGFGEHSGGQIPGKLFEYFASRTPIMCIAPLDSEAARIVAESGRGYVLEANPEQIAEKLHLEYLKYLNGEHTINSRDYYLFEEQFSSRQMAQKFNAIFTSLLSEKMGK